MDYEFNHIVMKNGKSKLIGNLSNGETLVVCVGDENIRYMPNNTMVITVDSYMEFAHKFVMESLEDCQELADYLDEYDTIIFYSNEPKARNLKYVETISRFVNLDKCVFMFSSEM